jgi:hypothetical protein
MTTSASSNDTRTLLENIVEFLKGTESATHTKILDSFKTKGGMLKAELELLYNQLLDSLHGKNQRPQTINSGGSNTYSSNHVNPNHTEPKPLAPLILSKKMTKSCPLTYKDYMLFTPDAPISLKIFEESNGSQSYYCSEDIKSTIRFPTDFADERLKWEAAANFPLISLTDQKTMILVPSHESDKVNVFEVKKDQLIPVDQYSICEDRAKILDIVYLQSKSPDLSEIPNESYGSWESWFILLIQSGAFTKVDLFKYKLHRNNMIFKHEEIASVASKNYSNCTGLFADEEDKLIMLYGADLFIFNYPNEKSPSLVKVEIKKSQSAEPINIYAISKVKEDTYALIGCRGVKKIAVWLLRMKTADKKSGLVIIASQEDRSTKGEEKVVFAEMTLQGEIPLLNNDMILQKREGDHFPYAIISRDGFTGLVTFNPKNEKLEFTEKKMLPETTEWENIKHSLDSGYLVCKTKETSWIHNLNEINCDI